MSSHRAPVASEVVADAIAWRHALHRMPEIAFDEKRTSDFVADKLASFGLEVARGLAGTGIVGTLRRGTSARSVGLRADMDALPIDEATGVPYASGSPGLMHACGHDGHMAMLLAAARVLAARDDIDGIIQFIFQPAEENEGGGRRMVEDGLFERFPADAVFGIHNWPALPVGSVGVMAGPMMAAFAIFDIVVRGSGAHAAMPHQGADPVLAAAAIATALQTVVARNVSPLSAAVLSVTQIHGGDTYNVIPDRVRLAGTARWFAPEIGDILEARLRDIAAAIASAHGCSAEIDYQRRYPATINDAEEARFAAQLVEGLESSAGIRLAAGIEPSMAAEDFAFMLERRPGAYIWLGAARDGDNPGLHSPRFDFNDRVLPLGIELWSRLAIARVGAA